MSGVDIGAFVAGASLGLYFCHKILEKIEEKSSEEKERI